MFESLRAFFRSRMAPPDVDREEADEARADEEVVESEELTLAACALLLELAYADDEFSESEREHLAGSIRRHYGIEGEEADELIRMAERQRATAVDLWQFTRLVKEHYSLGQKMVLAEIMWGLVYADGELESREDYLMRKITRLLDLRPGYLAEARKRFESEGPPADPE